MPRSHFIMPLNNQIAKNIKLNFDYFFRAQVQSNGSKQFNLTISSRHHWFRTDLVVFWKHSRLLRKSISQSKLSITFTIRVNVYWLVVVLFSQTDSCNYPQKSRWLCVLSYLVARRATFVVDGRFFGQFLEGGGEQCAYTWVTCSSHVALTCTVITTIWWRGALTCGSHVAINVHCNYYYMVEGSPHIWLMCGD